MLAVAVRTWFMASEASPPTPDAAPDEILRHAGLMLGQAIIDVLPDWAAHVVVQLADTSFDERGRRAGDAVVEMVAPLLAALLAADVDAQRGTPLALLRQSIAPMTEVLRDAGVARPLRDELEVAMGPDDVFGIAPRTYADLGEQVHEAGLRWGVAKAFAHRARHVR